MERFKVEKGIAIAPSKKGGGKYPFADLQVGDSFFVPCENHPDMARGVVSRVSQSYRSWLFSRHMFLHERPLKFRRVEGGVRVWRAAPLTKAAAE